MLNRIRREGQPHGLRLVDFFQVETFEAGDPHAPLLEAYDHGKIVVFDLETTGLDEARDEIVEIGAMRLEGGRRSAVYSTLVRPSVPVGESERFHGLSDERLQREGRPPEEAIGRLLEGRRGRAAGRATTAAVSTCGCSPPRPRASA